MKLKISRSFGRQAISIGIIADEKDRGCFLDELVKNMNGVPLEGKLVGMGDTAADKCGIREVRFDFSVKAP